MKNIMKDLNDFEQELIGEQSKNLESLFPSTNEKGYIDPICVCYVVNNLSIH